MKLVVSMKFCVAICLILVADVAKTAPVVDDIVVNAAVAYSARHPNTAVDEADLQQENCEEMGVNDRQDASIIQVGPHNAVVEVKKLWPNNTLYYVIDEKSFSPEEILYIEQAMESLVKQTSVKEQPCVHIKPRTNQQDFVFITDGNGCGSNVGRRGGIQRLTLANPGCVYKGIIMHELLHAFGFQHEQRRPDRDKYILINWDNIHKSSQHNFNKLRPIDVNLLMTPYDYDSIMHYGPYAFAVNRRTATIFPRHQTADIGQRERLSPVDIQRVQLLYDCIDMGS